jgi:hypothetical protein
MPGLPRGAKVIPTAGRVIGCLRVAFERDALEQSIAERLAKALIAASLLWVAIWWALS